MRHILYIQPIFAPTDEKYQQNLRSIQSFAEYSKKYRTDDIRLTVLFGGWAYCDELWNRLATTIFELFGVDAVRFDKNYGKAYVVNALSKLKADTDYDAILTADSDILFDAGEKYMFERLYYACDVIEKHKDIKWGVLALNQYAQCCHLDMCYQNEFQYSISINDEIFSEKIVWPSKSGGIAGGCIFVNRELWEKIGGYRIMGVYAGDDAYLLIDCDKAGFSWQMTHSLGVIHPFDKENQAYSKWKRDVCQRVSTGGIERDISEQVKEADEFWRTQK